MIAALSYLFTPVVPLVALKQGQEDPFIQKHARQALLWAGPFFVLLVLSVIAIVVTLRMDLIFVCLSPLLFLLPFCPGAIWAKRVYFGGDVTFPFGQRKGPS